MRKKVIAFILSLCILTASFYIYQKKKAYQGYKPIQESLNINELELYSYIDKSIFLISAGPESGTAFIIDADLANNKLYLLTNLHVVDSISLGRDVTLTPPKYSKLPTLCGKTLAHAGNIGIDVAMVEVEYTSTKANCVTKTPLKLSEHTGYYEIIKINKSVDHLSNPFNQFYYTAGYPSITYRRDKFIYTGVFEDPKFIIDDIVWSYTHLNFDYDTLPGSSGSPIVNYKGELFAILSTNVGGVGFNSVYDALSFICNDTKLQIKSC